MKRKLSELTSMVSAIECFTADESTFSSDDTLFGSEGFTQYKKELEEMIAYAYQKLSERDCRSIFLTLGNKYLSYAAKKAAIKGICDNA